MLLSKRAVYLLVLLWTCSLIIGCGSSDSPTDENNNTAGFEVQISPATFELLVEQQTELSYIVTNNSAEAVTAEITTPATLANVTIVNDSQSIIVSALDVVGSDSFTVTFSNSQGSVSETISFSLSNSSDGGTDNPDTPNNGGDSNTSSYKISWPSDYITLFEDEEIAISLGRNYQSDVAVSESFYLNSAHLSGQLSADGSQYLISADGAEQDTYGELIAVAEYNGEVIESAMQIIYYNKNRDLQTSEAPVIALISPEVELTLYDTTSINFDIYDPDSDRIAYRVIAAPIQVTTHINKAEYGYNLDISLHDALDAGENVLELEVSDGYNTDVIAISLTQSNELLRENDAPKLSIEDNVTLSLIKKLEGTETDQIAEFAFSLTDNTPEFINYRFESSFAGFTYKESYPYFKIFADDLNDLQYEQVTLVAEDANYQSKLTFHLYIKDNFLEFLGGNPNVAPLIEVPELPAVLETRSLSFSVTVEDFEDHPYEVSIEADSSILSGIADGDLVTINTELLTQSTDLETSFDLVVTDVFESERVVNVPLTIYKNTPPEVTSDLPSIDLVTGSTLELAVNVTDVDEGAITPTLMYDSEQLTANYENGVLTVTAAAVTQEFADTFIIRAEDEFGAVTDLELPLIIRTDNSPPVITAETLELELAPGQSKTISLTYTDPDGSPLTTTRFTNNDLLTFSYNQNLGQITFTLDASADYQQSMSFTTTTTDGFDSVSESITIVVPVAPAAPTIDINVFNPDIDEEDRMIVNFQTDDDNGDNVSVSVSDGGTGNISDLTINVFDNYLEIFAPENMDAVTTYRLLVTATDDSADALSSSEQIEIYISPINDAPEFNLASNSITLTNALTSSLTLNITDVDNIPADFYVEVLADGGGAVPTTLEVVGLDTNSLQLKAAYKGVTLTDLPLKLRVFDGQTYAEETILVSTVIENEPPSFEGSVQVAQVLEDNTRIFDVIIQDPDFDTDGETGSITKVTLGNVSGINPTTTYFVGGIEVEAESGIGVSITQIDQFAPNILGIANNQITIATALGTGGTSVKLSVIATDGLVSVVHEIQIDIFAQ